MRRIAFLWLPHWPTDLRSSRDGSHEPAPLLVWRQEGPRQVIAAACPVASRLGLHAGMKLAQAQAMVPGLRIVGEDPQADAETLRRLACWCLRYTPLTRAMPPDGVWLDLTGCAHLQGGEQALLEDLAAHLRHDHAAPRIAIAETPGAAHALARHGASPLTIATDGSLETVLSPLPVEALRIDGEAAALLHRFGIRHIGALRALPRAPLTRRTGAQVMLRLDQAFGRVFEPIEPMLSEAPASERGVFAEPLLTAESLSAAISRLADRLCRHLEARCMGARQLELMYQRADNSRLVQTVALSLASHAPGHFARLFQDRLEQVNPGEGPGDGIEAMQLTATQLAPLQPSQGRWHLAPGAALHDEPDRLAVLAPLIDHLGNRLGLRQIWRPAAVQSDVPERSVRASPPLSTPPLATPSLATLALATLALATLADPEPGGRSGWPSSLPRPTRLFDPPQRVRTMTTLPDHPPSFFIWRRHRHLVRRADGPERIAGEWWRRPGEFLATRDYFRLEDETGRRFWLFRRGDGEDAATGDLNWFVHGVF